MPITTQIAPALIVGQKDHDVGPRLFPLGCRRAQGKRAEEYHKQRENFYRMRHEMVARTSGGEPLVSGTSF